MTGKFQASKSNPLFTLALVALMRGAVSSPLLLSKHTDVAVAVTTSAGVVRKNPVTIAISGGIIALALGVGATAS